MSHTCKPTVLAMLLASLVTGAHAVELDIPSQPLDKALNALAHQTGERIIFSTGLTDHKKAPALKGDYSVRQALDKLLNGSGLELKATPGGGYTLVKAPPPEQSHAEPQLMPEVSVAFNR